MSGNSVCTLPKDRVLCNQCATAYQDNAAAFFHAMQMLRALHGANDPDAARYENAARMHYRVARIYMGIEQWLEHGQ